MEVIIGVQWVAQAGHGGKAQQNTHGATPLGRSCVLSPSAPSHSRPHAHGVLFLPQCPCHNPLSRGRNATHVTNQHVMSHAHTMGRTPHTAPALPLHPTTSHCLTALPHTNTTTAHCHMHMHRQAGIAHHCPPVPLSILHTTKSSHSQRPQKWNGLAYGHDREETWPEGVNVKWHEHQSEEATYTYENSECRHATGFICCTPLRMAYQQYE